VTRLLSVVGALALCAAAQAQQAININAELLAAARGGNTERVRVLLEKGAAINSRNRLGDTVLLIAAKNGPLAMAMLALERGADVNQRNLAGISPLMAAAFNGDVQLTRALLDRGADLTPVDRVRKTAAVYAAGNGHTEVLRLLLDHGVAVNQRYDNDLTALMWAAAYGHEPTVRLLLERGADPRAEYDGANALTHAVGGAAFGKLKDIDRAAARPCPTETVRLLLARAPDLRIRRSLSDRAASSILRTKCPSVERLISDPQSAQQQPAQAGALN
jgi:ankyrin repeat protein